jgi:uroporphyrinogen decarboxylase
MQTDLERFRATVNHRRPERILFHADFTPDLNKRLVAHAGTEDLGKHYGMHDRGHIGIRRPADLPKPDYTPYWKDEQLPAGTTVNDFGVAMVPSGYYHFWGYLSPLRNAQKITELENYPLDDVRKWDFLDLKNQADCRHAGGKIAGAWVGHMYETAWQIRGYEQFLMDVVDQPAWAECLLERLMEQNLIKAEAYARAGADRIATGDDVANQENLMFSPDSWRKLMLSRWKKVWGRIKEINPKCKIWYHSDGNISAIIGDLIEAGVDILNPLQPECLDLDAVHKRYGNRLVFDGCIGTQSTMPFGSPAAVRARVKEVIEKYGRNGGLIVSPTHTLEPDVPLENIDMFFAACNEYGR